MATITKEALVRILGEMQAQFFQAADETHDDPGQRSYRAGLSDGFNIARLMAKDLEE